MPDVTQLALVLDEIIIDRPQTIEQNVCADRGYNGKLILQAILARGYVPQVKPRGQEIMEKKTIPGYKARRWVVESCHSWLNRFRKLLVRYEKLTATYLAFVHLAAAIIAFRKTGIIYG